MVSSTPRRPFEFVANHIVLDFTNTVNARPNYTRDDFACADDIVDWACAAGMVDHDGQVMREAVRSAQFDAAISLREHLYGVFGPIAAGTDPKPAAFSFVTRRGAAAMRSTLWMRGDSGYEPQWPGDSLVALCDRLADEAVRLLRSPATSRIGSCAGCGWLFLDTSRAHARRWCSMNACGVRHKMRRYLQRQADAASAK